MHWLEAGPTQDQQSLWHGKHVSDMSFVKYLAGQIGTHV